ncbi:hypothetical protein [Pseudomonas chlororaphis]|uniref:hypothetical protein n=1 Tax=Pseudomonas chlororaphis TaxID=587753 RepID=UPI00138A18AD|nr:hypothetical protein [Pseudomonas chlororaphis]
MKGIVLITLLAIANSANAAPPTLGDMKNSNKAIYLLSNPNGTGALYLDGKKLGNLTNIDSSILKEAEPTPSPTPKPDGPDFPPCSATDCGGGAPKPTPDGCKGPACPGGTNFYTKRLIMVPQDKNTDLPTSLDEHTQKLINSFEAAK